MCILSLVSPRLITFVVASLILAIIPGPAVIYLTTQTLARGRMAGLASVGGIAVGNLMNAAVASFGLAALLATSSAAFAVIKFAGAAYLVYLGLRALKSAPAIAAAAPPALAPLGLFRDAVLVAFLNPKTALFFAALLPQFVDPRAGSTLLQNLTFGSVFVAIALCTDTLYVLTAAGLRSTLQSRSGLGRYGRYLSAGSFIGLGVYAAVSSPRAR